MEAIYKHNQFLVRRVSPEYHGAKPHTLFYALRLDKPPKQPNVFTVTDVYCLFTNPVKKSSKHNLQTDGDARGASASVNSAGNTVSLNAERDFRQTQPRALGAAVYRNQPILLLIQVLLDIDGSVIHENMIKAKLDLFGLNRSSLTSEPDPVRCCL